MKEHRKLIFTDFFLTQKIRMLTTSEILIQEIIERYFHRNKHLDYNAR